MTYRHALRFTALAVTALSFMTYGLFAVRASDLASVGVQLQSARAAGSCDRIEITFEAAGKTMQINQENEKVESELKLTAGFTYDERTLVPPRAGAESGRSVRYYRKAVADIQGDEFRATPTLREQHKTVVADLEQGRSMLYSTSGPFSSEELELIDIQGNSLLLDSLLPSGIAKSGTSWDAPSLIWSELLGIDAVAQSDVKGSLLSVKGDLALIDLKGPIEGAIDGASTLIDVTAKCQFNMKTKRINWFGMVVKEKRDVGHVGPALELTARVQMTITPISPPTELSNTAIASMRLDRNPALTSLNYESQQGDWTLLHGRNWHILQDIPQRSILRLVERGELIAQCNISKLPKVDVKTMGKLEQFQQDIQALLGENFSQFVEARQQANDAGYREYRIVADGQSNELPIRWVYYLLTDQQGNRAVLAFVVEANLIERFASQDRAFVDAFQLPQTKQEGESGQDPTSVGLLPSTTESR